MNATPLPLTLAKTVFQLAVADATGGSSSNLALTRTQFERWFDNRAVVLVIMEACGCAHHWARWLRVSASRCDCCRRATFVPMSSATRPMRPMPAPCSKRRAAPISGRCRIKSVEQQALQGLHRTRSLWMGTRTSRINALRGFCREFGIVIAQGVALASSRSPRASPIRVRRCPR